MPATGELESEQHWQAAEADARSTGCDPERVSTRARQARHLVVGADSVLFYDGNAIVRVPDATGVLRTRIKVANVNAFAV